MDDIAIINTAAAAQLTRRIIGPAILMGDGLYFDFEAPDATGMTIDDYAWGLASNNRFRGQTRLRNADGGIGDRCLYNVCQHVVLLAIQMLADGQPPAACWQGLMHESDEVPWPDIAGPAKSLMHAADRALIKRNGDAIDAWFDVGNDHHDLVKQYDIRMLATEKRDLMPHAGSDQWSFTQGYEPFPWRIVPWPAEEAIGAFHVLYAEIKGKLDA